MSQETSAPSNPQPSSFDLSLGLEDIHVLITGGCGLIGRVVADAFLAAGSIVSVVDLPEATSRIPVNKLGNLRLYPADISQAESIDAAFTETEKDSGPVEVCIALASIDLSSLPQTESICDADPAVWQNVFNVNINGTFLTAQRWLRGIRSALQNPVKAAKLRNVNLILMGSQSGTFGVRTMAAYAAGKAAVQYGLLRSLAKDVPKIYRKARVNAVAPGAVDTSRFKEECERYGKEWRWEECEATVGMAKPPAVKDVARTFVFLASERFSGSTHGQVLSVDGGKIGSVVWKPGEADE
ncbi:hypothetical protein M409DRAFT_26018 [Zasmidium cellare ATCC 36951]|uniref:NAD-dependent epimerase/dehydratase domain-containing protein n=1 Tax=Zasmidium cellare ATCC 36951 TaxID=1080233 RepID=A0A6A6C8N3_ZASCE|nr:uncharacterized protein M409DRAFT_26018 [Zasmidium cellare ATCC 36951]KAF2163401.1 hypothetical protein M409DRAFT_26018 [Zasmidium cellare ATCC 36951]